MMPDVMHANAGSTIGSKRDAVRNLFTLFLAKMGVDGFTANSVIISIMTLFHTFFDDVDSTLSMITRERVLALLVVIALWKYQSEIKLFLTTLSCRKKVIKSVQSNNACVVVQDSQLMSAIYNFFKVHPYLFRTILGHTIMPDPSEDSTSFVSEGGMLEFTGKDGTKALFETVESEKRVKMPDMSLKKNDNGQKDANLVMIEQSVKVHHLKITITQGSLSATQFVEFLRKESEKIYGSKSFVVTSSGENGTISTVITPPSQTKPNYDQLVKNWIESYISGHRNVIWGICRAIQFEPELFTRKGQTPCARFLLHGPPGSGKSTLPWRVAMALGRNLVVVNLARTLFPPGSKPAMQSKYLEDVRRMFTQGDKGYNATNSVYVLDELDAVIRKIRLQTEARQVEEATKKNSQATNGTVGGGYRRNDDEDRERGEITVEDLLTLFQGPMPITGSIIFATTNNFDEISQAHPALVRDGRLTPYYCGNFDEVEIRDFVKYWFETDVDDEFMNTILGDGNSSPLCNSTFVHVATEAVTRGLGYEFFKDRIMARCRDARSA